MEYVWIGGMTLELRTVLLDAAVVMVVVFTALVALWAVIKLYTVFLRMFPKEDP